MQDSKSIAVLLTIMALFQGNVVLDINITDNAACLGQDILLAAPTLANTTITDPVFTWYFDANKTTAIKLDIERYIVCEQFALLVQMLWALKFSRI